MEARDRGPKSRSREERLQRPETGVPKSRSRRPEVKEKEERPQRPETEGHKSRSRRKGFRGQRSGALNQGEGGKASEARDRKP